MHKEIIKAELNMAGHSPAKIAELLGVSQASVSLVISGKGHSSRIREAIAMVIGRSVGEIWPEKPEPVLLNANERALLEAYRALDEKARKRVMAVATGAGEPSVAKRVTVKAPGGHAAGRDMVIKARAKK